MALSVSQTSLTVGQSFTLSATVRNQGSEASDATVLRYYRSSDRSISGSDTPVGTDSVAGIAAFGASAESIDLNAPSSAGVYYYGACVDDVSGESKTNNNCTGGERVFVVGDGEGTVPSHPTNVQASLSPDPPVVGEPATLSINWDSVSGATSYRVLVSRFNHFVQEEHPNGSCTIISHGGGVTRTTTGNFYSQQFTEPSTLDFTYYFVIQAYNDEGGSCAAASPQGIVSPNSISPDTGT